MVLLKGVQILQLEGLGRGDIHLVAQKVAHGRGGGAHHLVHDLADGADGQLVELELLVRRLAPHQDIHNDLDVAALEQHDVAARQALHVFDFDAHGGFQVAQGKILRSDGRDLGRRNIYSVLQKVGYRGGRGAKADIHHFPEGVNLHRAKQFFLHSVYSLLCSS